LLPLTEGGGDAKVGTSLIKLGGYFRAGRQIMSESTTWLSGMTWKQKSMFNNFDSAGDACVARGRLLIQAGVLASPRWDKLPRNHWPLESVAQYVVTKELCILHARVKRCTPAMWAWRPYPPLCPLGNPPRLFSAINVTSGRPSVGAACSRD
jgi:hypothetical protein